MDFGVTMFATDYAIPIDELARAAEERGFESLLVPEHTHIPTSRRSPWPGGPNLPKEYWHTYDPFVSLAFAAAATKKLKVGTGICLLIERDPITTAKEVASLDRLSGGRFLFGVGAGWNEEEMENHGTDPRTRWKRLRESVLAMKKIWAEDEPQFHGDLIEFDPIWSWPKPLQKPHPPVLIGGHGQKALQRVVAWADGWLPISVRAGDLAAGLKELHRIAVEKGRDPKSISVSVYGVPPRADQLKELRDLGIQRGLFALPSEGADKLLPILDRCAAAMREVR